ncbi:SH3 domain-containing protein [Tropicibacter naphthalenivorans]|uniref:SH3b domain-containing protein n=1 Tax=Tropicibacter naphthalenivorans TaxID=441103 RepID=A0A0P1GFS6_9RHOB|nr:SH3 domain-containing protein [Tropicibacter naphthalenivorans]CUH80244.1 hypothetical protein TRN7648_02891 [Tropicibacter naphthalenivorans]SMC85645.1 Protein of unknown function [Tropicibacter naphthalenivorans]
MFTRTISAATAIALITATTASAAGTAFATTDLNLRAGPGPQFEIIDVIDSQDATTVESCVVETNWCKVSYDGTEGWAFGDYLTGQLETPVPVYLPESTIEVQTITYNEANEGNAVAGAVAGGAIAAAALGGPLAIIGGVMLGAGTGANIDPEQTTVTYIRENPIDPVFADGEVVVGAKLQGEAPLVAVPDSPYSYVNLNNTYALVEPASGEIVYILR